MATKAKNLALAAGNIDSTGNIMADMLDNIDSLSFIRSDIDDTVTGDITFSDIVVNDTVTLGSYTTLERDAITPVPGMIIYNTSVGLMEQYNSSGWQSIDAAPSITGVVGTINEDTSSTLTINGSSFKSGSVVYIEGSAVGGIPRALTTTYVNATQLTANTNATNESYTGAASYNVKVVNPSGLSGFYENAGYVDRDPFFYNASGTIASPRTSSYFGKNDPIGAAYAIDFDEVSAGDPAWENVVLLLAPSSSDTSLVDKSTLSNTLNITGTIALTNEVSDPYGGNNKVLKFTGSQYINIDSLGQAYMGVESSNWTIEAWWKGTGTSQSIFGVNGYDGTNHWILNTTDCWLYNSTSLSPSTTEWNHVAVVQKNRIFSFYLNGVQVKSVNANNYETNLYGVPARNSRFAIGIEWDTTGNPLTALASQFFNGYMYDIRLTKGVARYEGSSFTVPTSAFKKQSAGITYSLSSGSLPSGVTLSSNGLLTGQPANVSSDTTYTFSIDATSNGQTENRSFNIITKPGIVDDSLACFLDGLDLTSNPRTGTTWYDISGNNKHGTLQGSAELQTTGCSLPDNANTTNYISIPTSVLTLGTSWTMELWLYTYSSAHEISTVFTAGGSNEFLTILRRPADSTSDFYDANASGDRGGFGGMTSAIVDNKMVQFVASWNASTGYVNTYLNGVLKTTNTANCGWNHNTNLGVVLGQEMDSASGAFSSSQNYRGRYQVVRLYSKPLTTAEVLQNYNADIERYNGIPH